MFWREREYITNTMPNLTTPLHDHDDVFDTACMTEYLITYKGIRSRYLSPFLNAKHACVIHQLHISIKKVETRIVCTGRQLVT